jgi:hypothetical protein
MFNMHIFTEQGGSETTVLHLMPEAPFSIPARKVVGVMIYSGTSGTFLGRTSKQAKNLHSSQFIICITQRYTSSITESVFKQIKISRVYSSGAYVVGSKPQINNRELKNANS